MEYIIVIGLVLLSGLFSGLTLGMFSLSVSALERKIKIGNKDAKKVYKVRKNGNLLLCTLLLGNVAVNSTVAIFLGSIASGVTAGFIATGLIVVFGEILPQSIFSRFALKLGALTWWVVRFFMIILFPVAGPLAFLLDKLLGKELPTIWNKKELKEIIKFHEDSPNSAIDQDEERILLGALTFSDKQARTVMTPRGVVYALEESKKVNQELLDDIRNKGFTRIPVYKNELDNIAGILYAKELIGISPETEKKVKDLYRKDQILKVQDTIYLDNLFNLFITRRIHIAFVYDQFGSFQGLVTLEDVVEEVLRTEIMDESDKVADLQALAKEKCKERGIIGNTPEDTKRMKPPSGKKENP